MSLAAFETLCDVGSTLRAEGFRTCTAQWLVERLERQHGFELGAILLCDEKTGRLEPLALSKQGADEEFLAEDKAFIASRLPRAAGVTGWVAAMGKTARIGDVRGDTRYFALRDNIRSELCVPIQLRGKLFGVINTETDRLNAYNADDEKLLETICLLIAGALNAESDRSNNFLLVCAWCHNARVNANTWSEISAHLTTRFGFKISHGVCPDCLANRFRNHLLD